MAFKIIIIVIELIFLGINDSQSGQKHIYAREHQLYCYNIKSELVSTIGLNIIYLPVSQNHLDADYWSITGHKKFWTSKFAKCEMLQINIPQLQKGRLSN